MMQAAAEMARQRKMAAEDGMLFELDWGLGPAMQALRDPPPDPSAISFRKRADGVWVMPE